MNECVKCLANKTVKNIEFDKNGICNFCNAYAELEPFLHDYDHLRALFLNRIEAVRGKFKFDAAVGISGGKDSSYVLLKLVKEYKLKVKAFTINNGFLSDAAIVRINKMVKELGIEHEFIEFEPALLKGVYKYFVQKFLSPCIACAYLGYAVMINYASKIDAGLCIHGRSRAQMLRGYLNGGNDSAVEFITEGLKPYAEVNLDELYTNALKNIEKHVDKELCRRINETLLSDSKKNGYREFVSYFLYHPYNLKDVQEYLRPHGFYDGESEHFDCKIHNAAKYIKDKIAKRPHILNELCVDIREKTISKEDAKKVLAKSYTTKPTRELDEMCNFIGVNKNWLLFKAFIYSLRPVR